jgi:hypothetical protein
MPQLGKECEVSCENRKRDIRVLQDGKSSGGNAKTTTAAVIA